MDASSSAKDGSTRASWGAESDISILDVEVLKTV